MASKFLEYLTKQTAKAPEEATEVASLRATLYIGLGGFGCTVIRSLKAKIHEDLKDHAGGFLFLGLDTQPRALNDTLTTNEYLPLSVGVNPGEVARAQPEFLNWYRELTGSYQARDILAGADKTKAVGRLAFTYPPTFQAFASRLARAVSELSQFRKSFSQSKPPKVYVISTLAGGTGAGCLLDVLFTVGYYFRQTLGSDFPYQAVIVTPDVLRGEVPDKHMPDFFANTYASLKELHNFVYSDPGMIWKYDSGQFRSVKLDNEILPSVLHFVSDKTEDGMAVATKIEELGDIVVSYLLSEIKTPMEDQTGQPKVQDLENSSAGDLGRDDMPRAFSSFGVVRTGFPLDVVGALFAQHLIGVTLEEELRFPDPGVSDSEANTFLESHKLKEAGVDQLQDQVRDRAGRDNLKLALDAEGMLLQKGFRYDQLTVDCERYWKDMQKSLKDDCQRTIAKSGRDLIKSVTDDLAARAQALASQANLGAVLAFLEKLEAGLKQHQAALREESATACSYLGKQEADVKFCIEEVGAAAHGWLGRKGRVRAAVSNFGFRLEAFLNLQVEIWVKQQGEEIYVKLLEKCKELKDFWGAVREALDGHRAASTATCASQRLLLDSMADIGKRGPGNRFSLVDGPRADALYDSLILIDQPAAIRRIRNHWLNTGVLADTGANFQNWMTQAAPFVLESEIAPRLEGLDFFTVLEKFYGDEKKKRRLFADLATLSAPLFWLNPDRKEADYDAHWIVAVHPAQKKRFIDSYEKLLVGSGQGLVYSFFDSPFEVIIYQLKLGYTIHSCRGIGTYESAYGLLQDQFVRGQAEKRRVRPIHCWLGAGDWPPLRPHREEEETIAWFILGRAFNRLFPSANASGPDDEKNKSFISCRGANYYLQTAEDKRPERIGAGLADAVRNFGERPDWQQLLKRVVEDRLAAVGRDAVRSRIEAEYVPVLVAEIDKSERSQDPRIRERAGILRKLQAALERYMKQEMVTARV
jgi:hypothetical protein